MEVLQRTANRGSISTGYDIDNSLKFEADNTEIIYRANESGTNRKTFTTSLWFKRTELGAAQEVWHGGRNGEMVGIGILTYSGFADQLWVDVGGGTGNTGTLYRSASNQVIRDTSAWYHFVLAVDTTQGTEANRMKVWLNGVEVTSWEQHQIPAQNYQSALEYGADMAWGGFRPNNSELFSGYLAECHYLDGVAKVQTDFGEFDEDSGIWKPKAYTGTYGNNGCYMKYDDSSALGADSSGNGNTFTLNNITAADQALDTPTNNFCTLLATSPSGTYYKRIRDGGTSFQSVTNAWASCWSTIPLYSGKWYAEFKRTAEGSGSNVFIGAGGLDENLYYYNINFVGNNGNGTTFSVGLYSSNGDFYSGSGVTGSSYGTGDIICLAVDQDNGAIYFRKNNEAWMGDGTNAGNPASGASRTGAQIIDWGTATNIAISNYANTDETEANYGGYSCMSNTRSNSDENGYGLFVYEPPTGYLAICSKNLAETG